jgi:stress-induced morphogen
MRLKYGGSEMIEPQEVERLIKESIADAQVFVTDLTGTRDHYSVVVVSPEFEGKLLLKRHRMVNHALDGPLETGELHALQMKTLTPAEYAKQS